MPEPIAKYLYVIATDRMGLSSNQLKDFAGAKLILKTKKVIFEN